MLRAKRTGRRGKPMPFRKERRTQKRRRVSSGRVAVRKRRVGRGVLVVGIGGGSMLEWRWLVGVVWMDVILTFKEEWKNCIDCDR